MNSRLPSALDVIDAQQRLQGIVVRTPLLRSDAVDDRLGLRLLFKAECLQHSGAFKFRGAYNCLSRIDRARYPGGVVAYSTGNHGQAVATVARLLGLRATVVMPADAPSVKMQKVVRQGAKLVTYDRRSESREAIATKVAAESLALVVPPGDDPDVIAGQGTAALEALQDVPRDIGVDAIIVPCGGGGLAAGTCLAVQASASKAEVWAAEPQGFDDTRRSLASGRRELNSTATGSICDALLASTPAELPFEINRHRLTGVLTASDPDVEAAMRLLWQELRIVAEPGGAVALAALLDAPPSMLGRTVIITVSGGNVDASVYRHAIESNAAA